MPTPDTLRTLRDVLARLYPERSSASRVAQDAGIPITLVALHDRALDNWQAILQEAQKHNRLTQIIEIVSEEYGENPEFQAVQQLLRAQSSILDRVAPPLVTLRQSILGLLFFVVVLLIGTWPFNPLRQLGRLGATPAPTTTPQATAASFTYGVTVKDAGTNQPIANAKVLIEVAGKAPLDEYTDSNGYARIVIPVTHVERSGRLTINAQGYTVERKNIDLYQDQLPDEVRLTRQ